MEVLPCGIEAVKKHIKDIDLIPLQVPMFCDVTEKATEQMFQIYQEQGDIVACIGNILNTANLHTFQQANVAIGMKPEPLYRCNRCNGRINCTRTRVKEHKCFTQSKLRVNFKYTPSKLEQLSASLNSIACTFVFDSNTNI